jgi:hypothetical protein
LFSGTQPAHEPLKNNNGTT